MNINVKILNKKSAIFGGLCAIIVVVITAYVLAIELAFEFINIPIGSKSYNVMTDCMACHFYISEYDTKNGDRRENTYQSPFVESRETTQQGYGRYHIKSSTNAFAFVKYCKEKNVPNVDAAIAVGVSQAPLGNNKTTIKDYSSFMSKSSETVATPDVEFFIYGFWLSMSSLGDAFNRIQDSFILERYVFPALRKLGVSQNEVEDEDGQELLTALTTYVYSTRCDEDLNATYNSTVDKGDLLPFMYNKANANSPYEMAKFAYIYLCNNFGTESDPADGQHLWADEYGLVFNDDMDIDEEELETLRQLADKAQAKYGTQTGSRGIRLKGMTEDAVISSGYSVESKLQYIRSITDGLLAGVGVDADYRDLIDKNYLMVKHAMENQHIGDTIKDYCNGIVFTSESKLSQGQFDGKNSKVAILSDFQAVELKDKLEKRNSTHSDDDNISDGEELGTEIERDITAFVEKCNGGRDGIFTKAQQWKEFNEGISYTGTNDSDVIIKAKMWNYKSNPVLNDTDFDGLDDNVEHNKNPLNNDFSGSTMTVDSDNYVLDLDFNQDFRYFLWNSDTYNDELCTMSLIMSNLAEGTKDIKLKQGTINYGTYKIAGTLSGYMNSLGFKDIKNLPNKEFTLSNGNKVKGNVYIGYKSIDYYRKKRGLVGAFIGGFNDDNAYKELFLTAENLNSSNNVYEEIAEQVVNEIDVTKLNNMDLDLCYWISGKGIAGGIASEIARKVDNSKDIYCYTFASPYTHNEGGSDANTKIKNIINEDDFLIKSFIEDKAYYRNGEIYNASIKLDYMDKYRAYIGPSSSSYKGDCTKANTIAKQITREEEGKESVREILLKNLVEKTGKGASAVIISPTTVKTNDTTIAINNYNFKDANSYKACYVLSKVLEGINRKTGNETKYNETETEVKVEERKDFNPANFVEVIDELGKWYVNNVYTYQAGRYGAEVADNVSGSVIYYADEQTYQDRFKERFRESWVKASQTAKDDRRTYMTKTKKVPDNKVDLIMQDFNVDDATANGTLAELNVDFLKQNERYITYGREQLGKALLGQKYENPTLFGYYYNDLAKHNVYDDCSSFVSAVLNVFVQNNKEIKNKWTIYKHFTSAALLGSSGKSELEKVGFKCYEGGDDTDDYRLLNAKPLKQGDILVRNGHVEIYLGTNWSFGWGEVHSSYEGNEESKDFKWHIGSADEVSGSAKPDGYYFYNLNQNSEGNYTRVYRYKGGK